MYQKPVSQSDLLVFCDLRGSGMKNRTDLFGDHPINSWGCRRSGAGDGIIGK